MADFNLLKGASVRLFFQENGHVRVSVQWSDGVQHAMTIVSPAYMQHALGGMCDWRGANVDG